MPVPETFLALDAPGRPERGWRTQLVSAAARGRITMFYVSPPGDETLAVQPDYRRAEG
jgi:hypothetical protein